MEALLCSKEETRRALGIGSTKLDELIGQNKLETVKIGTRRLVKIDSIRRLAGFEPEKPGEAA